MSRKLLKGKPMQSLAMALWMVGVIGAVDTAMAAEELAPANTNTTTTMSGANANAAVIDEVALDIPCPPFWTVQPNPSVENSLSYVHNSGKMAISVTYISDQSGSEVSAETFSRVAAEQMNCTLPVQSNVLAHAWAFDCDDGIEALVYGDPGNLVLLSISGRTDETESYLDGFISFLSYQARR